jgi:hypothetical protein
MNSFALITAIALAADFSLAAASIARARIMKAMRKSLTALAAFAIATSFIASSFAGEFTVHQGKRYRATLSLSSVERLVDRAEIPRARLHSRARFGLGRDAQGGRRVGGQGHERQHAPADRGGCGVVRANPVFSVPVAPLRLGIRPGAAAEEGRDADGAACEPAAGGGGASDGGPADDGRARRRGPADGDSSPRRGPAGDRNGGRGAGRGGSDRAGIGRARNDGRGDQ